MTDQALNLGPDQTQVNRLFAQFKGAVAHVKETAGEPFAELNLSGASYLIGQMRAVAASQDLKLAVLYPGKDHENFDPTRVNAHLEKTNANPVTWRVTRFDIG